MHEDNEAPGQPLGPEQIQPFAGGITIGDVRFHMRPVRAKRLRSLVPDRGKAVTTGDVVGIGKGVLPVDAGDWLCAGHLVLSFVPCPGAKPSLAPGADQTGNPGLR